MFERKKTFTLNFMKKKLATIILVDSYTFYRFIKKKYLINKKGTLKIYKIFDKRTTDKLTDKQTTKTFEKLFFRKNL